MLLFINISKIRREVGILRSMGATRVFAVALCFLLCFIPWCFSVAAGGTLSYFLYDKVEQTVYENSFKTDTYGDGFSDGGVYSEDGGDADTTDYEAMLDELSADSNRAKFFVFAVLLQAVGFTAACFGYSVLSTRKKVFALLKGE